MPKLVNVVVNYVKIKNPALEYEKTADKDNEMMNKEYVMDVLIRAAVYKKLKAAYKKVKSVSGARLLNATEYEEAFKVAPPEGDEWCNGDGEYAVVKFKKKAYYQDGNVTKQPEVVGVKRTMDKNGKLVGTDIEVGNGSVANVQFREREWTYGGKPGLSLDLVKLQIVDLVEYVAADEDEFDYDDDDADFSDDQEFGGGDDSSASEPVEPQSKEAQAADTDW